MWGGLKARLTYANVMSTLAIFLLFAGGGAIAASKLKRNAVTSKNIAPDAVKGVDADESTFGEVPSAASADSAAGVAPDSVGASGIQNLTRAVHLPLVSFLEGDGPMNSNSTDSTVGPDFGGTPTATGIVFDDDAGAADTTSVRSQFMIPPDYVSGGFFAIRTAKPTETGQGERLNATVAVNGGAASAIVFTIVSGTGGAVRTLTPVPGSAYAPGTAVEVAISVSDDAGSSNYDDAVWVQSVEFRYTASQ